MSMTEVLSRAPQSSSQAADLSPNTFRICRSPAGVNRTALPTRSRLAHPFSSASVRQRENRRADRSGKMWPPLAPVETGANKRTTLSLQRRHVDSDAGEARATRGGHHQRIAATLEPLRYQQRIHQRHRDLAREMVVADSRLTKLGIGGTRRHPGRAVASGDASQTSSEPDQLRLREARQMGACSGRGYVGLDGELGCGESPAAHQREQHAGAGRVSDQGGNGGDVWFHDLIVRSASKYAGHAYATVRRLVHARETAT
jgi:hypothetical protein